MTNSPSVPSKGNKMSEAECIEANNLMEEASGVFEEFGFTTCSPARLYKKGKAIKGAPHKEVPCVLQMSQQRVKLYAGAGLQKGSTGRSANVSKRF